MQQLNETAELPTANSEHAIANRQTLCRGKHWTGKHRTQLANPIIWSKPSLNRLLFQHYCQSLEQIEDRVLQLDREISRLLPEWSLCNLVCQLQALKGVGQLIAITLVAELGDFRDFQSQTSSWLSGTGAGNIPVETVFVPEE